MLFCIWQSTNIQQHPVSLGHGRGHILNDQSATMNKQNTKGSPNIRNRKYGPHHGSILFTEHLLTSFWVASFLIRQLNDFLHEKKAKIKH